MRRRIILGIVLILVVVSAVRLVRLRKSQLAAERPSTVAMIPVNTGQVRLGDFSGERVCYGVIASDKQAVLRARVAGTVSQILAREGDQVNQGDPLLQLDGTPEAPHAGRKAVITAIANLESSVEGMRQTRKNLLAMLENDRMLHQNEAISDQQVELSENRYNEAGVQLASLQSELAAMKAELSLYTVRAPFSGVVGQLSVQLGDVVSPSMALIQVDDATPCKVTATVAAADLVRLRPDAPAAVVHGGELLRASVERVHPTVGSAGTGKIDILLQNLPFGLPLGASVEVRLTVDQLSGVLMVPADSVLEGVQQTRVHVVEDGTVRLVPVEVLARSGQVVAVRGNLNPTQVLVRGSDSLLMRLADGVQVAPRGEVQ